MLATIRTLLRRTRMIPFPCPSRLGQARRIGAGAAPLQSGLDMSEMESVMQTACDSRQVSGMVLLAADDTGAFTYSKAFGTRSISLGEPLRVDSVMWLASCTKLATSICAMQCVERDLLRLDDDLGDLLPELRDVEIIQGEGSTNVGGLVAKSQPITLRHLLTHSSGYSYEFTTPVLQQWRRAQPSQDDGESVPERYRHPILYEPGTGWSYGPSIDWAGLVVERVTKVGLEDYMCQNISEPLGIEDMTIFISDGRSDLQARRAWMSYRDGGSETVRAALSSERNPAFQREPSDAHGGGGLFSSAQGFFQIVLALLRAATSPAGSRILGHSTANAMFEPQLSSSARQALMEISSIPQVNHMMGNMPLGTPKDHGLGGMLSMENLSGWRRRGTMTWGGTPNLTWFIDRTTSLCGLYASQLMPIGDPKSNELLHVFEKAIYRHHAQWQAEEGRRSREQGR